MVIILETGQWSDRIPTKFYYDYRQLTFRAEIWALISPAESKKPQIGGGSGFIISEDGYILTNYHVIKDSDEITAILNNKKEYTAKIVGYDVRTDLAVLKIDTKNILPSAVSLFLCTIICGKSLGTVTSLIVVTWPTVFARLLFNGWK